MEAHLIVQITLCVLLFLLVILVAVFLGLWFARRPPQQNPSICQQAVSDWSSMKIEGEIKISERIVSFSESQTYSWDEFKDMLLEQGLSLSDDKNLIIIPKNEQLILSLGVIGTDEPVIITVNLNDENTDTSKIGRRFLTNNGNFTVRGEVIGCQLIIRNGLGPAVEEGKTTAGGIRHENGSFNVEGVDIIVEKCKAGFAGGIYFVYGFVHLLDGPAKTPGRIYARDCDALELTGGGICVWESTVTIVSDDGIIECDNCSTIHHGGGMITFYGHIILQGTSATIRAINCSSGQIGSSFSYAGVLQFGENFPNYISGEYNPVINFVGQNSKLEAINCQSGGAAGVLIFKGYVCSQSPTASIVAENNTVYDNEADTLRDKCSVQILNSLYYSQWPLDIYIKNNECVPSGCVDVYVNDWGNRIFPVNVIGDGTFTSRI